MQRKPIRFYLTIIIVRMATVVLKLLGKNATHFPGYLARKLCPDFLKYLEQPSQVVFVTGTNGKTTVSNLIAGVLSDHNYVFINNGAGSNITEGIITALMTKSSFFGKARVPLAVLEVDERCAPLIYPYIQPDYIVCTNLFRDSYRRNAHVQFIWDILNREIPKHTKLILNGEDLISSQLAKGNERKHFGISQIDGQTSSNNIIKDIATCPVCGSLLEYEYVRYNHIGKAHCPTCDFKSPELDYAIEKIDTENMRVALRTPNGVYDLKLIGKNITDAYNMIAAISLLCEIGVDMQKIIHSFEKLKVVATRFDMAKVNGKEIIMNLAKGQNPIACSRVCDFVARESGDKTVIMILDDYFDAKESSENVAWIFDVDFEFLNHDSVKNIIVAGVRHRDYHLRLLMAGIEEERIICCNHESEIADLVDFSKSSKIIIMHDITTYNVAKEVFNQLKERA